MAGPWEKYAQPQQPSGPWAKYGSLPPSMGDSEGPQEDVIATTKDGGRVIRTENGLAFASPGYSTTDQDAIARIMEGATPAQESVSSFDRQTIGQNPVAARGAKFVQGVPFVGEWADEAVGLVSPQARDAMRVTNAAMDRENPIASTALQIGGGIAGSIPMAIAAGPTVMAKIGTGLMNQAVRGGIAGSVAGAVEGAVSGAGAGDDGNRGESALRRGAAGAAIGGVVGAVAPAAAKGGAALVQKFRGSDVKVISRELGISDDAARVVKRYIEADDLTAAQDALARAGSKATLADAGPGTQRLLDAAVVYGDKAPKIAGDVINERAAQSGRDMTAALDATLGKPRGQSEIVSGIRQSTAAPRSAAYNAAYAQPIDYSAPRGRLLESLLKRAPGSAIKRANDLMRIEGVKSSQIMAEIADDGSVTFTRMPDVRQIDYITRALKDVADAADGQGKLGGTTALGRATGELSSNIRKVLRREVPEYGKALDTAADAISRRNAVDMGYDLIKDSTKRDSVAEALRGASAAERAAMKEGVRSSIDDTLATVRAYVSSPDLDINEFNRLAGMLRNRAARDKMTMLLGKQETDALYAALDQEVTSLELRAAIAMNSKTAGRQGVRDTVQEQIAPGALNMLLQGEPLNANKRIMQILTDTTPEALTLRERGIFDEIAGALVGKRGADAQVAVKLIERAKAGQPMTDAQARLVARALGTATAVGGYQLGQKTLAP